MITPDQYNDMHTGLSGGFAYKGTHYAGDAANIAQGDHFLSVVVPMIMACHVLSAGGPDRHLERRDRKPGNHRSIAE